MNELTNYFVPEWMKIAFLIAIPLPFILITLFIKRETRNSQKRNSYLFVLAFFVIYLTYIGIASYFGWFYKVFFPPVVLLLTTFPFAFFLFVILAKTKIYKQLLEQSKIEDIVKLHIFRVIGVFFVLLALHQALPKTFALIAGFGDILTAISSVFVAKAIQNKKTYAKKLTFFWNLFGAIDILFTAIAANVLTKISIDTGSMGVDSLAFFPFCIIPAFAPPVILFLHWSIFKKIKSQA